MSYHDELTGRYVFDIQETSFNIAFQEFQEGGSNGNTDLLPWLLSMAGNVSTAIDLGSPLLGNSGKIVTDVNMALHDKPIIKTHWPDKVLYHGKYMNGNWVKMGAKISTFCKYGGPVFSIAGVVGTGITISKGVYGIDYNNWAYVDLFFGSASAIAGAALLFVTAPAWVSGLTAVAIVSGVYFGGRLIGDVIKKMDSSNAHQDALKRGNLCFSGDMKVMMACGEFRRIDEIVVGDVVMSYDFDNETLYPTVVKRVDSPYHHEMVYLRFSKKIELRSTQDHPICKY